MRIGNRDLIHQSFGRLTVTSRLHDRDKSGNVQWRCICSCGNTTIVSTVKEVGLLKEPLKNVMV